MRCHVVMIRGRLHYGVLYCVVLCYGVVSCDMLWCWLVVRVVLVCSMVCYSMLDNGVC